jgi:hypothetical protein
MIKCWYAQPPIAFAHIVTNGKLLDPGFKFQQKSLATRAFAVEAKDCIQRQYNKIKAATLSGLGTAKPKPMNDYCLITGSLSSSKGHNMTVERTQIRAAVPTSVPTRCLPTEAMGTVSHKHSFAANGVMKHAVRPVVIWP